VVERMDAIVNEKLPPDPYRAKPQVREMLRSKL
jgi:hypothetical protein